VIKNTPLVSCPHCGESYLTAETLHDKVRLDEGERLGFN
jgi:hypothetical protein